MLSIRDFLEMKKLVNFMKDEEQLNIAQEILELKL
jgi:hypothetical protein